MKSKAPLALMEQMVMVLVFALAAVLCLQVFVLSDRTSDRNALRDRAVLAVENTAEAVKACRGDLDAAAALVGGGVQDHILTVAFDGGTVSASAADAAVEGLGAAGITACSADGELLFSVETCWQEVSGHA